MGSFILAQGQLLGQLIDPSILISESRRPHFLLSCPDSRICCFPSPKPIYVAASEINTFLCEIYVALITPSQPEKLLHTEHFFFFLFRDIDSQEADLPPPLLGVTFVIRINNGVRRDGARGGSSRGPQR